MPIMVPNQSAGGEYEKVLLKPGVYKATLAKLEVKDMPSVEDPNVKVPTLIWSFEIKGKTKTATIEHWSGATASLGNEKSWSRKFYIALTGNNPPTANGQTDLEELLGLSCNVRLGDHTTKKGETLSKIKDAWALETEDGGDDF